MPAKVVKKRKYEKVSFRDYIDISKWVFSLVHKIAPKETKVYLFTSLIFDLGRVVDTLIIAKIIDAAVGAIQNDGANLTILLPYFGLLFGWNLVRTLNGYFRMISRRTINLISHGRLERELYKKAESLGVQTLENPDIANKLFRSRNYINNVPRFFEDLIGLLGTMSSLLISLVIVIQFAWWVVPVIVVSILPQLLHDRKYRSISWKFGYENTESRRRGWASANVLTVTNLLHEIFINGAHKYFDKKFTKFLDWYDRERIEIRKRWFKGMQAFSLLADIGIYIGYAAAFARFLAEKATIGDVYFHISIVNRLSREIDTGFQIYTSMFEQSLRLRDVYELFTSDAEFADGKVKLKKLEKGPDIKINDLYFTYPRAESPVLAGVNINIKSGEKIAIVGHNGAGKTTLVKLLSRMYQTTKGEILINDHNINDLAIDTLYMNTGVLFQDFSTFPHLTVRENVVIGRPRQKVNEKRFVDALERADALNFVNDLPKKFDQILSEKYTNGIRLSTGQWQKLAIAKFFYRNAPLVIFDEPTAAIDAVSEYNIFNKIYSFFKDKTVVIISHRFSTVRNADRIIVIEKGRILEQGSHDELMKKDGYYAKSFKLQAEGYTIAE